MLEAPEIEPHHHKSGHSRLDLIMGALAVFLSGTSVFIAVRHGETMERLVAANSWPNLDYGTGNEKDEDATKPEISLTIKNTGVGPARIDTFELFYKDKPMANARDLLFACCGHGSYSYDTSSVSGEVLPSREEISFFKIRPDRNRPETFPKVNQERFSVRVRACYCSVFDECWVMDVKQRRPQHVDVCTPSQPVQFE